MDNILKLLLLEDSELDAELTLREIKGMDQEFDIKIVSTKPEFELAVHNWSPHLIISDFNLQSFNGDEALAFAKMVLPETPFITLSGSITKNMEVSLLKERANDVLTKDNLKRLPFAINRVLTEKKERKKLSNTLSELEENLKFQEALAEISLVFNSDEVFENKIQKALEIVGVVINVSRAYMFEDDDENGTYTNTFEWCADGVDPEIDNLKNVPYADTPSLRPILMNERKLSASDINTLPEDLVVALSPQNIKALLVFPVYLSENFFGFVGVDETKAKRNWSKSEDKLLKTVSGIFSNAYSEFLARKELEEKNEVLNILLKEKEVLVGEVHHRVKNNLALISSFLQLEQFGVTKSESKDQIISANILRIKSISIVHETVYQKGSFTSIDVLDVLKELISESYSGKDGNKPHVHIKVPDPPVKFNINIAIPFSLLISEIIFQAKNISKEAFITDEKITLSVNEENDEITISIVEPGLAKVLSELKVADDFTQIIEVLALQIEAQLIVDSDLEKTSIKFANKSVKGSSSSLEV